MDEKNYNSVTCSVCPDKYLGLSSLSIWYRLIILLNPPVAIIDPSRDIDEE